MRRILLMDNQADVLDKWGKLLEQDGFDVLRAATIQEAEELLLSRRLHLAILDIRMQDDEDENDVSGFLLVQDPRFRMIPKIVLTGFPDFESTRAALIRGAEGHSPALDYVAKSEGPSKLRAALKRAFEEQLQLNWDLHIGLDDQVPLTFPHMTSLIQPDLGHELLVERAGELEDLFRRLFHDYRKLRIGRAFWHREGRLCVSVLARSMSGTTDSRLVICGDRHQIEAEPQVFHRLAPQTGQGLRILRHVETMHFGGILYTAPESEKGSVRLLRDLVQEGRERQLRAACDQLLKETLPRWHQRGERIEAQNLMALYRQKAGLGDDGPKPSDLGRRLDALVESSRSLSAVDIQRADGRLVFSFPREPVRAYPDPVSFLFQPLAGYDSVICRVSPGRLTLANLLVDGEQNVWPTDFAGAGLAVQWWDYVCLEAQVRFEVGEAPDLLAWQEFEACLTTPADLHTVLRVQEVIPELRPSVSLIERIRRQAGSETGGNPLPYYAGLLAWTMAAIARHDPDRLHTHSERMHAAHLLLAAGTLTHRLVELVKGRLSPEDVPLGSETRLTRGVLRLDDDGVQVWIGQSRCPDLVGQELLLFRCLYRSAGQVVDRAVLMEEVLDESYDPQDRHQAQRLNSLVRRLRQKIEPTPGNPRYILTVRGQGYRMETKEEAPS